MGAHEDLIVTVVETPDEQADRDTLRRLARIAFAHPGKGRFLLQVQCDQGTELLNVEPLPVRTTPELVAMMAADPGAAGARSRNTQPSGAEKVPPPGRGAGKKRQK